MANTIEKLDHDLAEIFIANDNNPTVNYSYGGTRMVTPDTQESEAKQICERLMWSESALKNQLINAALSKGVLNHYSDRLPGGFLDSKVGGARCVIRPKHQDTADILVNPEHPDWDSTISPIFQHIGESLNQKQGKIKLTPDFGRFAGLADTLNRFTPHSLGINCDQGGCGGKSSYSATGIISAIETLGFQQQKEDRVTLIGAVGAMGSDVLKYFLRETYQNVAVCDLVYDDPNSGIVPPDNLLKLPSKQKAFTTDCLERGGLIVATTVGQELENSFWETMPRGTTLLLAHNMAIPGGEAGAELMQRVQQHGVFALPGQVLTLGGALTSRVEWFWRQSNAGVPFDKPLAHLVVRDVVKFLVTEIKALSASSGLTPYEAMLRYADREAVTLLP
ncbi:MAG: hypothetical protein F6K50_09480 [Moorea sp. SIO3I7]|uniref:hypothetical protein n=1 Tax=unclassified Moorena TaxID=2683338 RepID=UPI0013C01C40|nr:MULTISPECIES: hypothetical protein [unclassified Moorena]NEN95752.1 hypothetical protein [Moorena sp. SIO3I7]NEO07487.1 hypothetical protein [Moorena sp. SIO3I8]NEO24096.1 hypothetical protein [Moorena sp. SIO4A5]NEQ55996.1 hypothetical protein [Moorena sp. SIO4A1]